MMQWIQLAIKNILHRPLAGALSVLLFAIAVGLMVFLTQINDQIKTKFEKNLAGVDLVIGAKGSPLQMILCNMYHIDAPTGNIGLKEAAPFLRTGHPLIKSSVPLSLGDSHKGYRIVGTNKDFLTRYEATLAKGEMWTEPMHVVVGHTVAQRLDIQLGDQFQSAHGLTDNDDMIHTDAHPFVVTGILERNGSVVDLLILTPTQSVWQVHESHDHHDDSTQHGTHGIEPLLDLDPEGKEITSVLVEFKGTNYQSLNMARNINENTDLMAASPAIEINRLFAMMGIGMDVLESLVYLMALVAFISVFISLWQSMRARRYEIAVLKVQGASGVGIFSAVCWEALLLAFVGGIIGLFLGKTAIQYMAGGLEQTYKYQFEAWVWSMKDVYILLVALLVAIVASLIPAISAGRMNVHQTLSQR